ncbi:MAG: DUF4340 domain-containing protein [Cyanophyceae cyanobacterium]
MKLQRSTWFLVAIALVLSATVYVNEIEERPSREATADQLFDFEEAEIQGVVVKQPEQTLEFERNDDDAWQMKQPQDVLASDAAVSFLLNLLVEGESDRSFTIAPDQKQEYGLDTPQAEIQVELEDGQHELILGNPSFDNQSVYAQIDSANQDEEITVFLVPIDFQYAVERELTEWQQPEDTQENE